MRAPSSLLSAACAAALAAGCTPPTPHENAPPVLTALPPLDDAPTTAERTLAPAHDAAPAADNPALPENIPAALTDPLGDVVDAAGEAPVVRTVDGSPAPPPGPNARRLVRFVHLSDIQLMDDESPTRAADFDSRTVTSAIRPYDALICRMLNAAVRTINALNKTDPIDFVLLGGDNADSAQKNEVEWVMQILDGSPDVECDSGDDDDIDPASDDDGKDPFAAAGLDVPWKWVNGNHDVLVQGNFPVTDDKSAEATGTAAQLGTRDYAAGGWGTILTGDGVIADPERALLAPKALLDLVGADGDGHGLKDSDHDGGKGFYSFDVDGTPLTFFVLDTTHFQGGAEGVLTQSTVDRFVKPVLDDAHARGRIVVLASHHSVGSLTPDGGEFGVAEADALTPDAWLSFLGGYPEVRFSMVGHAHRNQVTLRQTPTHPYWEVMTSALADFPHQFRIVEIWDDDNGTLRLESKVVDYAADDDPPAALGRRLGLVDFLSGWNPSDGRGRVEDRNVELIVPKP